MRAVLFRVCSVILQRKDEGNAVYVFMGWKRAEGKYFFVYRVAGAAKLLCIYYALVKECLREANDLRKRLGLLEYLAGLLYSS